MPPALRLKDKGTIEVNRFTLRNQPTALLRRRRCHHRRVERVQRHERRQAGRPQHRRAADGGRSLAEAVPRIRVRTTLPEEPSASPASCRPHARAGRSAHAVMPKSWRPRRPKKRSTKRAAACAATSRRRTSTSAEGAMPWHRRKLSIRIDGELVSALEGQTILEAARPTESTSPRSAIWQA